VGGFSYRTKKWGEIMVSKTRPVKFDDRAYERLVLPPEKKMLIQSLILNTNSSFADIISGKVDNVDAVRLPLIPLAGFGLHLPLARPSRHWQDPHGGGRRGIPAPSPVLDLRRRTRVSFLAPPAALDL
jgi:hypothetical protein